MPKTTKTEMTRALESFEWNYRDLCGGTQEETARQAPTGILTLEKHAKTCDELFANGGKLVKESADFREKIEVSIPRKLALYRFRYLGGERPADEPGYIPAGARNPFTLPEYKADNVVPFVR